MTVIWLFGDCRWQRFEDDGFDAEKTRNIGEGQIDGYAEHIKTLGYRLAGKNCSCCLCG